MFVWIRIVKVILVFLGWRVVFFWDVVYVYMLGLGGCLLVYGVCVCFSRVKSFYLFFTGLLCGVVFRMVVLVYFGLCGWVFFTFLCWGLFVLVCVCGGGVFVFVWY